MAGSSQVANMDNLSTLGSLLHENFVSGVLPLLDLQSPTLSIFEAAGPGEFSMVGEKLVFAVDHSYTGGAMGTSGGELPDHEYVDPITLETTPVRLYVRRAVDNFWVARGGSTEGAFEDFLGRVMEQMWDDFERAQARHVQGSSDGTICQIATRTSNTVVTIDDGYGLSGVDPAQFLEPGQRIGWLDASNSYAVGGVGTISSIVGSGGTYTLTLAADWENGSGTPQTADGDVIVRVTTDDQSANYFTSERNAVPLGLADIIDPDGNLSTYLGQTVATYKRLKPVNLASSNFDEVEVMKFVKRIAAKGNATINPSTNIMVTNPAVTMELARSLLPYSQIQREKGQVLPGGWQTVQIANYDFIEDSYAPHNILYCICMEDMRTVPLDGAAAVWAGDGSEFSRLADFDGKEWYAKRYLQRLATRRNRSGALTGITVTDQFDTYTAQPFDL